MTTSTPSGWCASSCASSRSSPTTPPTTSTSAASPVRAAALTPSSRPPPSRGFTHRVAGRRRALRADDVARTARSQPRRPRSRRPARQLSWCARRQPVHQPAREHGRPRRGDLGPRTHPHGCVRHVARGVPRHRDGDAVLIRVQLRRGRSERECLRALLPRLGLGRLQPVRARGVRQPLRALVPRLFGRARRRGLCAALPTAQLAVPRGGRRAARQLIGGALALRAVRRGVHGDVPQPRRRARGPPRGPRAAVGGV
mmetsp:Transcript_72420/g.217577  ORF Transcript_72420/g.217577 Transcript_72420/m.217577 type:complete len:256 (-) Transcript_72420:500-1267(-)